MKKAEKELHKKAMSKKALRDYYKRNRITNNMNTGTRTHKSKQDYNRKDNQKVIEKELKDA